MARPSRWDDVVRSAARVFRRRGFARASLEEIADELGMWKGSLYNYISSKEDLLVAVVKVPAERLIADVRTIRDGEGTPEEKLRAIVRCHVDVLVDIYDFAAVYLYEAAASDLGEQWRETDREYTSAIQGVVEAGIAAGDFRGDRDPHLMTMTLLGALNWLTRWWNPQGDLGPEAVTDQIADTVIHGFAVPAPVTAQT
ncbi:TetR/AcrR family transcriptional regulator [Actinomycetospora endophytica]|uniref:TetR/AcrR family transcriptional regulator n=1 Tax=Actinomycetospora endophytica TaxID=2291215 RepID=A0ABS8PD05_9PSEU|nr:TetR/AcrR family transcriptional regulator [Actinomycetospora endophytica]MCD2195350.1 TetR/AcrR family transcriptional regulator [Actinomycetospora endophytica]